MATEQPLRLRGDQRHREADVPRTVEITVPSRRREELVERISAVDGVIGLRVQEGISRNPPGDVISLQLTNRALPDLARMLADAGIGSDDEASCSTSEPLSLVSAAAARGVVTDTSEATWEEMEVVIAKRPAFSPLSGSRWAPPQARPHGNAVSSTR